MSNTQAIDADQLLAWLRGTAQGDANAFRALYDATSARLYGFVLRMLGQRELAEEALQEGFVAIWHAAASYQSQLAAPMTWMTTIVRNKALDLLRRTGGSAGTAQSPFDGDVSEALHDPAATPIESLLMSREAAALADCMAELAGSQRQVIGLAFFHDLSHSEVARQLALPIGTVKTWIRRGLEKLKACLGEGGRHESA